MDRARRQTYQDSGDYYTVNMPAPNHVYRARISRVVDGDTLDVVIDQGMHNQRLERVRLLDVNCSEVRGADRDKGNAATSWVKQWLVAAAATKWPLVIQTEKSDAFGRYLAHVWDARTGECLNRALINSGHAVPYKER